MKQVQDEYEKIQQYGIILNIQWATSCTSENQPDIKMAIDEATRAMRARKLIDSRSRSSKQLSSLVRALEECEPDFEERTQHIQEMGEQLGKRMGLTDIEQSKLSLLCLLHDIGKIGIPSEVLNKQGKLTEAEYKILQSHVEKGYQIAYNSRELKDIAEMILRHHERWDGKGYPDGLSKESIPLLSRVVAVLEAYDTMRRERPYRPAISMENAVAELRRYAGTQFDPAIVSEFIQMLKDTVPDAKTEGGITENADVFSTLRYEKVNEEKLKKNEFIHELQYSHYLLNDAMKIINIDDNFELLTGYSRKDVEDGGLGQMDLILPEDRTSYLCAINEQLANTKSAYLEHRIMRKDGSTLYVFCYGKMRFDTEEHLACTEIVIADSMNTYSMRSMALKEESREQRRLEHWESKYRCDSLTGLLTHESLRSDVEMRLMEGKTREVMLMMDVDNFKSYNDTYGHLAGDAFLIKVAKSLTDSLRSEDLACRMGGDEFAAVLSLDLEISDEILRERVQQIFEQLNQTLEPTKSGTSLSMGYAVSSEELRTFNQLYEAADQALYRSKNSGKSCLSMHGEYDN
jgi:diguanylate cyclase (GGDEF)-like protein/PAS domain S-box-containing protein